MSPALLITLAAFISLFVGVRLGLWWARKSLDRVIDQKLATRGLQVSDQLAELLRKPTVDGVARKMIRKMGLCGHGDILLAGVPITLVCHDRLLLQRVLDTLTALKPTIHAQLMVDNLEAQKAAAGEEASAPKIHAMDEAELPPGSKVFKAPPLASPAPFTVIEGDKK